MPWLPKFLNLWTAAGAAAVVIPSLLVLYFLKLRRREMDVASTILWKKAIQDLQVNAPFQKLRKNLLLLLQLLLLLLLLAALGRPIAFFTPGPGKTVVILIDRSASMSATDVSGHSRLEEAKIRAKNLVGSLDRGATAMVIAFDDAAEAVQPWSGDTAALKSAIDRIQPTDRKSRLKQAYQLAEAQTHFNEAQLRTNVELPDVYVYSDGRVLDGNDLSIKGNLKYEKIGTDTAGNVAIVSLDAKRNYENPTQVQIFARLANFGPDPVKADVELWISPIDPTDPASENFQNRGTHVVNLIPERWDDKQRAEAEKQGNIATESVEFSLDLPTAAVIRVDQKYKENDVLAADDSAQVVLPPPKPLTLLVVTPGNYFLDTALPGLPVKDPVVMSPADYESKQPKDYDVIIFDRYSPKQLPPSGNFLYFGGIGPGLKLKPTMENGLQVMTGPCGVLDWNREHSILKYLALDKIYAAETMKFDVPPESEVLIEGTQGPLLILHREGRSLHLVTTFDLLQSNWPLRQSFPVFLYNSLQFMALGTDVNARQSLEPGATPRISRVNLERIDSKIKSIHLTGPGVSRDLPIPSAGDFALPPFEKVGLYKLEPSVPQFERIAVSLLDANESNLMPIDHPPGNIGETVLLAGGKSRLELWWWLVACGALPLLLIEWWVYTRRVHL